MFSLYRRLFITSIENANNTVVTKSDDDDDQFSKSVLICSKSFEFHLFLVSGGPFYLFIYLFSLKLTMC